MPFQNSAGCALFTAKGFHLDVLLHYGMVGVGEKGGKLKTTPNPADRCHIQSVTRWDPNPEFLTEVLTSECFDHYTTGARGSTEGHKEEDNMIRLMCGTLVSSMSKSLMAHFVTLLWSKVFYGELKVFV